jgi:uncharacterized membrane protein (UPF0136 family)
MRKNSCILTIIYGLVVFALGFMGWWHAGSIISFAVGGTLGALVILSGFYMLMNKRLACYSALGLTFFLALFFGVRFSTNQNFLNISMAFFSAIVLVKLTLEAYRVSRKGP